MKRNLVLVLCCLLIAAVFAGCEEAVLPNLQATTQPVNTPTTNQRPTMPQQPTTAIMTAPEVTVSRLTAEKMEEIEQAWLASKGQHPGWYTEASGQPVDGLRYYGTYNGYDILFAGTDVTSATARQIGGVSFAHTRSFVLYAYADGVFYELEEAFENDLISQENLQEAAKIHVTYQHRLFASSDVIEAMKTAFFTQYVTDGSWTTADLTVIYYGEYDGAHVGFISGIFNYTQAFTSERVGQFTFQYVTGQKLQLYYEGQIMGLRDAYEQGILSDEALGRLYRDYAKEPTGEKE